MRSKSEMGKHVFMTTGNKLPAPNHFHKRIDGKKIFQNAGQDARPVESRSRVCVCRPSYTTRGTTKERSARDVHLPRHFFRLRVGSRYARLLIFEKKGAQAQVVCKAGAMAAGPAWMGSASNTVFSRGPFMVRR